MQPALWAAEWGWFSCWLCSTQTTVRKTSASQGKKKSQNHWASPVLIYLCRLEKHQPWWDRCLTKIRAGKTSLPNMPRGVKCTWKLWNADEIPGLGSLCLHHKPGFSLLQGSEQGQEERLAARTALSSTLPAPLNCVAVWLKISKWIHQPLPAGFIISNAWDSHLLLCWELVIHCVASQCSQPASSTWF